MPLLLRPSPCTSHHFRTENKNSMGLPTCLPHRIKFDKKKRSLLICRLFMLMRGEEVIGQQIAFFEPDK
jgi:hypothetical protein